MNQKYALNAICATYVIANLIGCCCVSSQAKQATNSVPHDSIVKGEVQLKLPAIDCNVPFERSRSLTMIPSTTVAVVYSVNCAKGTAHVEDIIWPADLMLTFPKSAQIPESVQIPESIKNSGLENKTVEETHVYSDFHVSILVSAFVAYDKSECGEDMGIPRFSIEGKLIVKAKDSPVDRHYADNSKTVLEGTAKASVRPEKWAGKIEMIRLPSNCSHCIKRPYHLAVGEPLVVDNYEKDLSAEHSTVR